MKLQRYKTFYYNGQIEYEEYYLNNKLHNPEGPAFKSWYDNGQIKYEEYYLNGKRHNSDGPAYKCWYDNGQIEYEEYWLNGTLLTKEEFNELKSKCQ